MKQALLIGPIFDEHSCAHLKKMCALEGYVHVIAVDGGADFCSLANVIPTLFVGDGDSASTEGLAYIKERQVESVCVDAEKDDSDFALALDWLLNQGVSSFEAIGFIGGRLDHQLALLGEMAVRKIDAEFFDELQSVWVVSQRGRLPRKVVMSPVEYQNFSVFALLEKAVVSVDGARWPLLKKELSPLISLGLSNEFGQGAFDARVLIHEGSAVICANKVAR